MKITVFNKFGKRRQLSIDGVLRVNINENMFCLQIKENCLQISSIGRISPINILFNNKQEIFIK
jgi:hypothetical protein